jgi:hypothetical protein
MCGIAVHKSRYAAVALSGGTALFVGHSERSCQSNHAAGAGDGEDQGP